MTWMNNKGMGMATLFMCILVCTVMIVAVEQNDYTFKPLNWDNLTSGKFSVNETSNYSSLHIVIKNIVYKFIDATGYIVMETTNTIVRFTLDHPDMINWKVFMFLVILSICLPVFIEFIKILIIAGVLIKEIIDNRRDKKKIDLLKEKHGNRKHK